MTDYSWIAPTITAAAGFFAAVGSIFVSLSNGRKQDKAAIKQDEIHTSVNGNLGEVKASLRIATESLKQVNETKDANAEREVSDMRLEIADLKRRLEKP